MLTPLLFHFLPIRIDGTSLSGSSSHGSNDNGGMKKGISGIIIAVVVIGVLLVIVLLLALIQRRKSPSSVSSPYIDEQSGINRSFTPLVDTELKGTSFHNAIVLDE